MHTKEPWVTGDKVPAAIYSADESPICLVDSMGECGTPDGDKANAARIVACVNACAGISTEELERHHELVGAQLASERSECDELLRAAEFFMGLVSGLDEDQRIRVGLYSIPGWNEHAAAIAKAKGVKPIQPDEPCIYPSGIKCKGDGAGKACNTCPLHAHKGGAA